MDGNGLPLTPIRAAQQYDLDEFEFVSRSDAAHESMVSDEARMKMRLAIPERLLRRNFYGTFLGQWPLRDSSRAFTRTPHNTRGSVRYDINKKDFLFSIYLFKFRNARIYCFWISISMVT